MQSTQRFLKKNANRCLALLSFILTCATMACPDHKKADDAINLHVNALEGSFVPGRLAVVWFSINGKPEPSPMIGYDVPIAQDNKEMLIPLSSVTPVSDESLFFCPRKCTDETQCPCIGQPKFGLALVAVLQDTNANGKIDLDEVNSNYGLAHMVMAYSETDYPAGTLNDYNVMLPDGMKKGLNPYRVVDLGNGKDGLSPADMTTIFDLNVCASAEHKCAVPEIRLVPPGTL